MTSASFLLTTKECSHLEALLRQNANVFAWTHSDMLWIDPSMAAHKLNILPNMCPMRQKVRSFHLNRQKVIQMKIDKLFVVGFIKEATYPDWLANVFMVPKKRGTRQVCVDYTNLNDVCPKDNFILPRIDKIVDSTCGNWMLSFLDVFFSYHKIPMFCLDQEKMVFITPHRLYYYNVMPFGLKNVGATYQRLMTKIFKPLMGRTVEVYINDIVVKSKTHTKHVQQLEETFSLMRKYNRH